MQEGNPATASEDFSVFARTWKAPLVFWFVGGTDPQKYAEAEKAGRLNELPSNHSPQFAPVLNPTLRVGIEAMLDGGRALAGHRRQKTLSNDLNLPGPGWPPA